MTRLLHAEQADCGCLRVLLSCFRTKRNGQTDLANDQNNQMVNSRGSPTETENYNASQLPPEAVLASSIHSPTGLDATSSPTESRDSHHNHRKPVSDPKRSDLWKEAFDKADKSTQDLITENFSETGGMSHLISLVQSREEEFKTNSAQITVAGRTIYWRDCANRVITWIMTCGDIATPFAPAPSSTVWSALKVLLEVSLASLPCVINQLIVLCRRMLRNVKVLLSYWDAPRRLYASLELAQSTKRSSCKTLSVNTLNRLRIFVKVLSICTRRY